MKTYCVIGGSSGIGKALCEKLSVNNRVYATYYQHQTASLPSCIYAPLDVLEEQPDFSFLPDVIDGIVYCPGTILLKPFNRITQSDLLYDYRINVIGAIQCIQAVLPLLKRADNAAIVLFSSVAAQIGMPFHSVVSSSKGAIEGLTKALSAELAPRIRVNCVAPSLTNTPLASNFLSSEEKIEASINRHPLKKIGTAENIAANISFLLSDDSNWMTGQILHVDGGMSSIK